jgi:hypothetical protein
MVLRFALFVAIFVRVTKYEHEESSSEFRMQSQRVADSGVCAKHGFCDRSFRLGVAPSEGMDMKL